MIKGTFTDLQYRNIYSDLSLYFSIIINGHSQFTYKKCHPQHMCKQS